MDRNFKFQLQDSFLEYFFGGRFEKRITLSEKKPPLDVIDKRKRSVKYLTKAKPLD